jgi:hypothetical protein
MQVMQEHLKEQKKPLEKYITRIQQSQHKTHSLRDFHGFSFHSGVSNGSHQTLCAHYSRWYYVNLHTLYGAFNVRQSVEKKLIDRYSSCTFHVYCISHIWATLRDVRYMKQLFSLSVQIEISL